ncbi:hypothetical protein OSB04_027823 [Centaurea solstitialis]|uniref:Uncharacterized protein n=1 Tax=Centaurea solstitialis TaxID=347529 RepID=A0AA38SY36_9ASTR|nr:hypothetical protein OSB04_027823 [Centaurea solstitialis]
MDRFLFTIIIIVIISCFGAAISTSKEIVEYLPGFQGPLPFHLETGYVGVDENEDVQLFYYFIESESNPKRDPLILWITGGPGCSSISGLVYENGPVKFEEVHYNGSLPTLISRHGSWTKVANIIFLDIPVGAGFSYRRSGQESHSNDFLFADQTYEFMRKWLKSHSDFISNPFYVGGDSYSGRPIPVITQLISNGNEAGNEPYINLKGYLLGNPRSFPEEENFRIRFANGMGLITDELYKSLVHNCRGEYRSEYISSSNVPCLQNLGLYQQCIDGIELPQILEPNCSAIVPPIKLPSQMRFIEQQYPLSSSFYCPDEINSLTSVWANDARVREALHIRKGSIGDWERCGSNLNFTKILDDTRPYHLNLSKKGYRSLIYSGDHDMVIPHQSTEAWIKDLNYSITNKWRSWKYRGQIAGYNRLVHRELFQHDDICHREGKQSGGGHATPQNKPDECFAMFKRCINL